jgi:CheY-like chemotaxis protein
MSASISNAIRNSRTGLVLIVDDEPFLLELAEVTLRSRGHQTKTFPSAEAALAFLECESEPPALLITDYAMKALTGLDLIERARLIHPAMKCLMVSGTVNQDIYRGVAVKPDRFLAKPYQLAVLNDVADQLLEVEPYSRHPGPGNDSGDSAMAQLAVAGMPSLP